MRTISVKEAAAALGVTPRAVIYRIEKGDLKGVQTPNPYGVKEWRIYPTKEIAQKLRLGTDSQQIEEMNFQPDPVDAIDAETVGVESLPEPDKGASIDLERERFRIMAEEMIRPLVQTIREQERVIEDQGRQLKLLPDLQKRAEEERKAAELKELELVALNKQIAALQEEMSKVVSEPDADMLLEKATTEEALRKAKEELESERASKIVELAALKSQVNALEELRTAAEIAQSKIEELERQAQELKQGEAEKEKVLEELRRMQEQKDAQIVIMQEQVAELSKKPKSSWLKRFFLGPNA